MLIFHPPTRILYKKDGRNLRPYYNTTLNFKFQMFFSYVFQFDHIPLQPEFHDQIIQQEQSV
ncbi:hypothetical protein GCM10007358_14740 [Phocicoccus schoeneichii]|nr:hypothetical protein GCM10007358_14740 [Jeotgalicoccus schoeneichii]